LWAFGVAWVFPEKIADLLFGWYNWVGKNSSKVWNLVLLSLMWTIWRERNRRTFEDKEQPKTKLFELFYGHLFDWARIWGYSLASSLADFVVSLHFTYTPSLLPV
jgi:hypothetical protein